MRTIGRQDSGRCRGSRLRGAAARPGTLAGARHAAAFLPVVAPAFLALVVAARRRTRGAGRAGSPQLAHAMSCGGGHLVVVGAAHVALGSARSSLGDGHGIYSFVFRLSSEREKRREARVDRLSARSRIFVRPGAIPGQSSEHKGIMGISSSELVADEVVEDHGFAVVGQHVGLARTPSRARARGCIFAAGTMSTLISGASVTLHRLEAARARKLHLGLGRARGRPRPMPLFERRTSIDPSPRGCRVALLERGPQPRAGNGGRDSFAASVELGRGDGGAWAFGRAGAWSAAPRKESHDLQRSERAQVRHDGLLVPRVICFVIPIVPSHFSRGPRASRSGRRGSTARCRRRS